MLVDPQAPESLLVIMAHPDDAEFGAGATIASWTARGTVVDYCVCTRGDKGTSNPNESPGDVARRRETEQRAAAAVLGVRSVRFLGHPDGLLQPTLALRRDLVRVIRELRPAAVLAQDPSRRFGPTYVNHPDHRAAGEAAIDAVYPSARDPLVFPELRREGLEPHRVAELFLTNPMEPTVAVDVEATAETKIAALREHRSQITEERLRAVVPQRLADAGAQAGLRAAELFARVALP